MRPSLVMVVGLALLACGKSGGGSGGGGGGGTSFIPTYTPAAKGTPTGTPVTQAIDAAGGTVHSADGRLDLVVPAGALAASTQLTVQPITNTAPNGLQTAYRLLPEGVTFAQPVTLTFHLDATQALALAHSWIATQHADGLWYAQPHPSRDAGAGTVSVTTTHFSDWTIAQTLYLDPHQARVRTAQTAEFTPRVVVVETTHDLEDPAEELAAPVAVLLDDRLAASQTWSVDQVQGGDSTVGHIMGAARGTNGSVFGDYLAPNLVPTPSEVTVSLSVVLAPSKGRGQVVAVAPVTVYAQEVWNGTSHITMTNGNVVDATFTFAETTAPTSNGQVHHFEVQSGQVHVTVPATLPSGCTQSVTPTDQSIGPHEGSMTATYSLANGPENPMVAGMGTTVWQATYSTQCPNGPGTTTSAVEAEWWPAPFTTGPTPVEAVQGVYDDFITTPTASGNVHLKRQ